MIRLHMKDFIISIIVYALIGGYFRLLFRHHIYGYIMIPLWFQCPLKLYHLNGLDNNEL